MTRGSDWEEGGPGWSAAQGRCCGGRARGDTSPALTSQEAEWRGQVFEAGESISDGVLDGRLGGMSVR